MPKNLFYIFIGFFSFVSNTFLWSQNSEIEMHVVLHPENNTLEVHQKIVFINTCKQDLYSIYLHDWNHAYSDKNSNLGKRFIENYNKRFFFSSEKNKGFTNIHSILANNVSVLWKRESQSIDQIEVTLNEALKPNESVTLELDYQVKVPSDKFTGYGCDDDFYNLKYWYIIPVVFEKGWQTQSNLNLDDLFQQPIDYEVLLDIPNDYSVSSNLDIQTSEKGKYTLSGKNMLDFEMVLAKENTFESYDTDSLEVVTNLNSIEIGDEMKKDLLNRQIHFLRENLGSFPQDKILVNKTAYEKTPLYGFNQLPGFLRPFSDVFEWDLRMFQTLSKIYLDQSIFSDTRKDAWLREGIPYYLMFKYIGENYPEKKMIGNISKIWGIKSYHISDMKFNERYLFAYQYIARINYDQSLSSSTESLSNYNREIANRFKTALGLIYLEEYTGNDVVKNSIKKYFEKNSLSYQTEDIFKKSVEEQTSKDVNWFFGNFIHSNKNIDLKIENLRKENDSIKIKLNFGNTKMPVPLYGFNKDQIISKYWLSSVDSIKTFTIPFQGESRWVLNYEGFIPEVDLKNNWVNTKKKLISKPLKIRFLSDAEDPYSKQLFLEPMIFYNYYDGISIANTFHNRTLLKKPLEYKITPSYSIKSNSLTGTFLTQYTKYFENKKISSFSFGHFGSYFHYQENLAYRAFSTYAQLNFKKPDFRQPKNRVLSAYLTMVNRDTDTINQSFKDAYKYNVFHLNYLYSNPNLIDNFLFNSDIEIGNDFSKLYSEVKFRRLINNNQQFETRLFGGFFLYNNTSSDYFSYGVNRPYDYLFRYRYFARSATSGFFSQQFIMNDGGFKAEMPVKFANQWITSMDVSIGLWKWFEIYTDVGLIKNRNQPVFFAHDKGIRFNFATDFLEIYFPMHSNNGWEIAQPHYEQKIRFVFTTNLKEIFSFLKRGVF